MAYELIGAAGMTVELKQTYDRIMLSRQETDTVYLQYGKKKPIPARGGKSIEFRGMTKITITAGSYTLQEGSTPTETQATFRSVAATISQYGQFSYVSDILKTQGYDPVMAEYASAYGEAMAEGLDVVVRDGLSSATTIQYADTATVVGTSGAGAVGSGGFLDAAELREMRRTLRRNGARPVVDGKYVVFIHPDNLKDMMEDGDINDTWKDALNRGAANPLITGMAGDWEGLRIVETNNLRIRASYGMSGADVYEVIGFGDGFYGHTPLDAMSARLIVKDESSGGTADPLEQRATVGWKAALAAVILNNDFGVLLNCASSRSLSA